MKKLTESQCHSCEEQFNSIHDPLLLPCLHTLCTRCCQDAISLAPSGDDHPLLLCPFCSEPVHTAAMTQLPTNSLLNIGSLPATSCTMHNDQQVNTFCETCQLLACQVCLMTQHIGHDLVEAEQAAASLSCRAEQLMVLVTTIQEGHAKISGMLSDLFVRQSAIVSEICTTFQSLCASNESLSSELEIRRELLISDTHTICAALIKRLELQCTDLESLQERCQLAINTSQALATTLQASPDNSAMAMTIYRVARERLDQLLGSTPLLKPSVEDSVRFVMPAIQRDNITQTSASQLGLIVGRSGKVLRDWAAHVNMPLTIVGSRGTERGSFQSPVSLCYLPSSGGQLVVVEQASKRLQLFSCENIAAGARAHVKFISSNSDLAMPRHVAATADGMLWVADHGKNRLCCFTQEGVLTKTIPTHRPVGIAIMPSSQEIYCTDFENHCIRIFSSRGRFVRAFGTPGRGPGCFRQPTGLAILPSTGELVVADFRNNRLQILSAASGEFIRQITGVNGPWGVSITTEEDLILVAEEQGHCVSIWNSQGMPIQKWGTFGSDHGQFAYPNSVIQLADGRIAVADNSNHRVQLF